MAEAPRGGRARSKRGAVPAAYSLRLPPALHRPFGARTEGAIDPDRRCFVFGGRTVPIADIVRVLVGRRHGNFVHHSLWLSLRDGTSLRIDEDDMLGFRSFALDLAALVVAERGWACIRRGVPPARLLVRLAAALVLVVIALWVAVQWAGVPAPSGRGAVEMGWSIAIAASVAVGAGWYLVREDRIRPVRSVQELERALPQVAQWVAT